MPVSDRAAALHLRSDEAPPRVLRPRFPAARAIPGVRVCDADPGLLDGLDARLAGAAAGQLVARTIRLQAGPWTPETDSLGSDFQGWLGILVLAGMHVRTVDVGGLRCCELLGPGDLLRPWDHDEDETLRVQTSWRTLESSHVALLDEEFARRACRWPSVTAQLLGRAMSRSRSLSVLLAITQARRADVRVRSLFWHLCDRWGRVTPDGVALHAELTHSVISQLTGLRRPTVSLTLAELARAGEIVRPAKDSWLLRRPVVEPIAAHEVPLPMHSIQEDLR